MATNIDKSPLPKLGSARVQSLAWDTCPQAFVAYCAILKVEQQAIGADLVSTQVAGYLLLELINQSNIFGIQPGIELTRWILSPSQSVQGDQRDVVIQTGELLRDRLIRAFRTVTTQYPQPSSHPSCPYYDTVEDMKKDSLECAGDDYRTSKKRVLARDDFRCVITGIFNQGSLERCPDLWKSSNFRAVPLQTAHIFNESMMKGIDPAVEEGSPSRLLNKTRTAAGALAILELFGFVGLAEVFKGRGGVHQAWNLLTLESNIHSYFDTLHLWFEPTNEAHCYKVCTLYSHEEGYIRDIHCNDGPAMLAKFNSQHENVPPPDPLLLALHATCARVAHMSGAAAFFDQVERDAEDVKVLAFDGSSALLLSSLLSPHATVPGIA